jgi:putative transposase
MARSSTSSLYSTDLSEQEWQLIKSVLPTCCRTGRPRRWSLRLIVNALFYQLKTGCQWRLLPREFPPWQTVYSAFRKWRDDGTWERLNARLREKLRSAMGRATTPSGAVMDSQSIKTSEKGGFVAMMASRRSMAASAICWWTLRASY